MFEKIKTPTLQDFTNPWCHVFCHISPPSFLISLSFHLNLALSAGLISRDDRWKGPFFPHSHRDTRNTELMKEWWYLITFQRIAPASEPTFTYKWMAYRCTSCSLLSSDHGYTFDVTCCRGIGIACVVEEIQSSYVFRLGISASDRSNGINMFRKARGKMNNGILQGL